MDKIDLSKNKSQRITHENDNTLVFCDGLSFYNNTLIAHQSSSRGGIYKHFLTPDRNHTTNKDYRRKNVDHYVVQGAISLNLVLDSGFSKMIEAVDALPVPFSKKLPLKHMIYAAKSEILSAKKNLIAPQ